MTMFKLISSNLGGDGKHCNFDDCFGKLCIRLCSFKFNQLLLLQRSFYYCKGILNRIIIRRVRWKKFKLTAMMFDYTLEILPLENFSREIYIRFMCRTVIHNNYGSWTREWCTERKNFVYNKIVESNLIDTALVDFACNVSIHSKCGD